MNKTAIVIVYFGRPPLFLNLFLKSCSKNNGIDFIFITDWDYAMYQFSPNCILITHTKEQFKQLVNKKLGFLPALENPYKLCDYKPAWPYLYEDYLKSYRYIGWCDIDVVFGNLEKFFLEDLFKDFDFITITDDFISGAFTLLKNEQKYTTLFQQANGWKEIFQDERHYAFDEGLRIEQDSGMDSFSSLMERESASGNVKILHLSSCAYERHPQKMIYDNGQIIENDIEYAIFHFVIAKRNSFFVFPDWPNVPDRFLISKYGFSSMQSEIYLTTLLINPFYRKQVSSNIKKKMKIAGKLVKDLDLRRIYIGVKRQLFTRKWINE